MNNHHSTPDTGTDLRPGTVLQGQAAAYTVMKVLGQGSFGITYLARTVPGSDDEVEQYVCLKEFFMHEVNGRSGTSVTSSSREGLAGYYRHKFEQEAEHLQHLRHRHIVMVTDAFHANGTAYYAMQYIQGENLDSLIRRSGRLTVREALPVARQIGGALAFMHSKGMLHLDVKPANIMMPAADNAVLIDFGLSKQYSADGQPESSTKVGAGTPGYAPIEQASYREGKGFPVTMDVYALGATLFKMLTGKRPPEASDILNDGFPRGELTAAGVPRPIVQVVEKAMAAQRAQRYADLADFISHLNQAAAAAEHPSAPRKAAAEERTGTHSGRCAATADSPEGNGWARFGSWLAGFGLLATVTSIPNFCMSNGGDDAYDRFLDENLAGGVTGDVAGKLLLSVAVTLAVAGIAVWWLYSRWRRMSDGKKWACRWASVGACLLFNFVATVSGSPVALIVFGQAALCLVSTALFEKNIDPV